MKGDLRLKRILIFTIALLLLATCAFATTETYIKAYDAVDGKWKNIPKGFLYAPSINSLTVAGNIVTGGTIDPTEVVIAATGDRGINLNITQSPSVALTGTLEGIYARATGGDTGKAGTIRGCEIGARLAEDATGADGAAVVTGGYFWADTKTENATVLRGLEVSLDGAAGGTSTTASGIVIFNNSSATQTNSYAVDINEGSASGRKAFTKDIRLQNGESIDNATDGVVAVTGALLAPVESTATNATTTIDGATCATYYGKTVFITNVAAVTVTLPANGAAAGTWFRLIRTGDEALDVNAATADTLITTNNATADGISFDNTADIGATVKFISNGTVWIAINESDQTMTVVDAG
jgi:hypothetical protein